MPSVDLGVHEFGMKGLSAFSRRTDTDWWAVIPFWDDALDAGSHRVLRSADAGVTWREDVEAGAALGRELIKVRREVWYEKVAFLVWYTPDIGLAVGSQGAQVLRTEDGGRTWGRVKLPASRSYHFMERVGGRTWIWDYSGHILRSDDAGASWQELEGEPQDRCRDLSFSDPEHGLLVGDKGSLWVTEDGGMHWRRLETRPVPPPPEPGRVVLGWRHVRLLTPEVAWLDEVDGRYQTTDGGRTWHSRPRFSQEEQRAGLSVARTPGGKQVIVQGTAGAGVPVEAWVPSFERFATVMGEDSVVTREREDISIHVAGRLVRKGPLLSAGTGVLTPLDGVARRPVGDWLGWKGAQLFASSDAGGSWREVSRLPESPIRALVFPRDGRVFADTESGLVLVSDDHGRSWTRSKAWLDAYDFTVAAGRKPGEAPAPGVPARAAEFPMDCLLTSPEAVVKVRFNIQGCFGGSRSELDLTAASNRATLSAWSDAGEEPVEVRSRKLPREEAQRFLRTLVEAARRPEVALGCGSTTRYTADIEWSCIPGQSWRHKVSFEAPGCGPLTRVDLVGGATLHGAAKEEGYARALGIHAAASRLLQDATR